MNSRKQFGLSADERIKSRKDFEKIFTSGKVVYSPDKKIRAVYLVTEEIERGVKIAAVVSKKAGNAVWRNRVKRLIKEVYRLNKQILTDLSLQKNISIKVAFSPNLMNEKNFKDVKLNDVKTGIIDVMFKIKSILQ
ncbi:MAG: ribonuclease P protein component [Ignavibacteriaceae bacterium]